MKLRDENPAVKIAGDEKYWLEMYKNVARADVGRAQTKSLMFIYSKVKNYAGFKGLKSTLSNGHSQRSR